MTLDDELTFSDDDEKILEEWFNVHDLGTYTPNSKQFRNDFQDGEFY